MTESWASAASGSKLLLMADTEPHTTDVELLNGANTQFIEAFRQGSWSLLEPLLSPSFRYLDGHTGELWDTPRYIEDLLEHPQPSLRIDQLVIHIDGDTASVSARTHSDLKRNNRYLDTYHRESGRWYCVHACVWPLPAADTESNTGETL